MSIYKGNYYSNLLYITSLVCYLINTFLNHTMFNKLPSYTGVKVILFSIVIISLFIKLFFIDIWNLRRLTIYTVLLLLMSVISLKTGDRQLVTLIALILGARNVNFRYVLATFFITIILLLFITYLFTLIDVIPNLQYTRIRDGEIKIRNSFGTEYPTVFAAYLQSIVIAYAYLMKLNRFSNHIILIILSSICCYIALEYADARMSGYSIILFLTIYYFSICFFRNISKHKFMIFIIGLIYIIGFIVIFYFSYYFEPENEIFSLINDILSGRLRLGYQAFQDYKIPLLGQEVNFIGLGGSVQEMSDNYNYVDSSYLQFMIKYGIIFTILSILSFTLLTFKRLKLNDYRFIAIIVMLSFNSMIEDRLLDLSVNIYWVLLLSYYFNYKTQNEKY